MRSGAPAGGMVHLTAPKQFKGSKLQATFLPLDNSSEWPHVYRHTKRMPSPAVSLVTTKALDVRSSLETIDELRVPKKLLSYKLGWGGLMGKARVVTHRKTHV